MPQQKLVELKVGFFVTIGLVLAMIVIFTIGSEHEILGRQYRIYSHFADISGLRKGAPVQLAGLKVGFVDEISFPDDPANKDITVELMIRKKFQDRIRADSVATIETQGLLGDKFIYVSVGTDGQPIIPDGGIIGTKKITSIFALADKAGSIMDDVGEAAKSLKEFMASMSGKEGKKDLQAILASIRATLEQIQKGKGLLHAIIYDPKGEEVITDLAGSMHSINHILKDADKESKGQIGGLIANLRKASYDLQQILSSVRRGEGTLGKLVTDPSLYNDLEVLFGRVSRNRLLRAVIRSTLSENERQIVTEEQ